MALTSGTRLGPYEILAPIGAGGMGEVYKANDTRLDRIVAIKVLPEHLAESPERKARFEREAKAISQLGGGKSPGLLPCCPDHSRIPCRRFDCKVLQSNRFQGPIVFFSAHKPCITPSYWVQKGQIGRGYQGFRGYVEGN